MRRLLLGLLTGAALLAATEQAQAQEILLTGPLAGAPAVRKLRLYRERRFEVAPAVSFTLLDEYQRTMVVGGRLQYNVTDWLGIGAWGGYGVWQIPTGLTSQIQEINESEGRNCWGNPPDPSDPAQEGRLQDCRLTQGNVGPDFEDQIGQMDWIAAPQLTAVPFRGKLALFQKIFVDSEIFIHAGAAFVGIQERANCGGEGELSCSDAASYTRESRVAIAPTFGLGFSFFVNKWNSFGLEYRAYPFAWNRGGFDSRGAGEGEDSPDLQIDDQDRTFRFNQMLTISWGFYFPMKYRVSE